MVAVSSTVSGLSIRRHAQRVSPANIACLSGTRVVTASPPSTAHSLQHPPQRLARMTLQPSVASFRWSLDGLVSPYRAPGRDIERVTIAAPDCAAASTYRACGGSPLRPPPRFPPTPFRPCPFHRRG